MEKQEIIKRFATLQNISEEEAKRLIDADTEEDVLKKIQEYTLAQIRAKQPPLNRKQRRALKKKLGDGQLTGIDNNAREVINNITTRLNYIDLIQKLRQLNQEKENENGDTITEDDDSISS